MNERRKGAATALVLGLLEAAIQAQKATGVSVEVTATFNNEAAQELGVWGEGQLKLTLIPCVDPRDAATAKLREGTG